MTNDTVISLPPLSAERSVPADTDVLIVGATGPELALVGVPEDVAQRYPDRLGRGLAELAAELGATSKAGSCTLLPAATAEAPRIVVTGLGDDEPTPERVRRAAGAAVRTIAGLPGEDPLAVVVSLGGDEPELRRAAGEGALLGSYRYAPVSDTTRPARIGSITLISAAASGRRSPVRADLDEAATVATAVATAREWVNLPPNLLYPATFADRAAQTFAGTKASVEVLDEKALRAGGYGGILAVGGGSSRLPRLVRVSYRPRGATAHLVLVGKGITFDSGGLNLKTGEGMYTMKCDMAGAAAVLAATRAIVVLGLKINITCYASMAENLPSDTAYRPSDVLSMYGGTTVENGNCDAEGRLVMADALARGAEDEPDLLVDVATLTGACVMALGERTAGVMASDEEIAGRILDAAETSGEAFWPLPIPEEIRAQLDSQVADVKSTGARMGGALVAAAFLREFTGAHDWAHLDIAGPAFNNGLPYGYLGEGGTGFGVRTLVELAATMATH